ncbi:MAG: tetratricopeptide repeat protein [Bacteroidales bacterium]|nr:tetratricopeptide repeat protein [Candidatus Latescibacterota bacterium]
MRLKSLILVVALMAIPGTGIFGETGESLRYFLNGSFYEMNRDLTKAYSYFIMAEKSAPGDEDIQLALARVTFDLGKFDEARKYAGRIAGSGRVGAKGTLILAETEYRQGNTKRAVRLLDSVKDEENIPRFEVHKFLARIYLESGDVEKARGVLESAREINPLDLYVNYRLGFIYAEADEIDNAIESFRGAVRSNPSVSSAHLALASMLHHKGLRDEAKEEFTIAVELDPDNRAAIEDLSELYYEDGDFRSGADLLGPIFERGNLDESGKINLGRFYYQLKEYDKALEVFTKLLSSTGERPAILRVISEIELGKGRLRKAEVHLKRLIDVEPENFTNYIGLLLISFGLAGEPSDPGEEPLISPAEGRAVLKEAVKRHDKSSANDNYMLGSIYRKIDDRKRALDFLLQAEKLQPGDQRILLEIASLFEDMEEYEKALERVRFLYEISPDDPSISNFYGYLLAQKGDRLGFAEELLISAIQKEPENGYFLDSLGWIKYRKGEYEKAREIFIEAVTFVEGDPIIWEHLGDTYFKLNLFTDAEEAYSRSVVIDPDKPEVQGKLQKAKKAAMNED